MSYGIEWKPAAIDRLKAVATDHPEAPGLVFTAVYELASNPCPTNSTQLGTSPFRRLLLGYWRVTYEIVEADQIVQIHMVGRSLNPR
ncbi:mRNA interferase RelE/StbE [Catenulispora sp. MAP12-49]|uniref:type II toxin-antitoxin system RelE family toxin n=1 Tax=unclassified Catenulispora TaxID=414885 RepID=UPI003515C0E3